jgi:DNA-binding HxlR family transcriptional regulator
LTSLTVNRQERRGRAGELVLSRLASPLEVPILDALSGGPVSLSDLRRRAGSPPLTTMRKHLRELTRVGALSREPVTSPGGVVSYELCDPGHDLLRVAEVVRGWLAASPHGPLELGGVAAKSAIKAMVEGWSTTLLRALAARPLSLTELDALIAGISYPSLERRLTAMRLAGQVEACSSGGRRTPYSVSRWARRAIGPLAAAAAWERRYVPAETAPIGRLDIETAFLLTLPLLRLSPDLSGIARLAVEAANGSERRLAGALVGVEEGRIAYCRARLEGDATACASGSAANWLGAVAAGHLGDLEVVGDRPLIGAILDGLRSELVTRPGAESGSIDPPTLP